MVLLRIQSDADRAKTIFDPCVSVLQPQDWVIDGEKSVEMGRWESDDLRGKEMRTWQMAQPRDIRMVPIRQLSLNGSEF
jgi:hypothetical protein